MTKVKKVLESVGVRPSKQRGQNFLHEKMYCDLLVSSSGISNSDWIIEIGPGLGALTKRIYDKSKSLTCIEIEQSFIAHLHKEVGADIEVYNIDFRKFDLSACVSERNQVPKIISNLPYVFSTDAILWLIAHRSCFSQASLLVQKEFAERIASTHGSKSYGSISVHAQFYFDISLGVEVPGTAFHPTTKVPSQQLCIFPKKNSFNLKCAEVFFEKVVRASFSMRRKTLINCISQKLGLEKAHIEKVLADLQIQPNARAEDLSIQSFCDIADALCLVATDENK